MYQNKKIANMLRTKNHLYSIKNTDATIIYFSCPICYNIYRFEFD